jgi:hypothetical protein
MANCALITIVRGEVSAKQLDTFHVEMVCKKNC